MGEPTHAASSRALLLALGILASTWAGLLFASAPPHVAAPPSPREGGNATAAAWEAQSRATPFDPAGGSAGVPRPYASPAPSSSPSPHARKPTTRIDPIAPSVGVGDYPIGGTYDSWNGLVYVVNWDSSNVSLLNGTADVGSVPVGSHPAAAIFDNATGLVYVLDDLAHNVSVLNGSKVVRTIAVGTYPTAGVFDPKNGFVYEANQGSNNVSVINGTKVLASVRVGYGPGTVAYDAADGFVYVIGSSNNMTVINGTSVVGWLPASSSAWSVPVLDPRSGDLYVVNGTYVNLVQGTKVVGSVDLNISLAGLVYDAAQGFVEVTRPSPAGTAYDGTVVVLNGTSIVSTVKVGADPIAAVYDSANQFVYVLNENVTFFGGNDGNVTILNGTVVRASVPVGELPCYLLYDAGNRTVYAMNRGDGNVSVVSFSEFFATTFRESGLPVGTAWGVSVEHRTLVSSRSTIHLWLPNGTFAFALKPVAGYHTSLRGNLTVSGTPSIVRVQFARFEYRLVFRETGLPLGTSWQVTLAGVTETSNGSRLVFFEPNGTYAFQAAANGYTVSPASGSLMVAGASLRTSLTFT